MNPGFFHHHQNQKHFEKIPLQFISLLTQCSISLPNRFSYWKEREFTLKRREENERDVIYLLNLRRRDRKQNENE